ncbi:murein hydrolase activator EnvC family protein [Rugamonas apoptosis]|uniref:Peptidoglycan DD-metalloendopeptidase family protein n=1 Tax=Rugamonas apoptosis TaxID=2758570 RepID=A0A7W2IIH6_9BURK|nr:peptidoglycan DD-metalloendopeptidase family protein [Rugamonas apoptosis]MBA5685710.1 peptidoglycan DD-metalloendopeptidase family protein [Rugamonas apoptosis]
MALAGGTAHARTTERARQKAAAEAERAGLQQKLTALKRDISKTESAKDDAADTLAESEQAISDANRSLRDLTAEQAATNDRLARLSVEHDRLVVTVEQQKQQLSRLLRQQYVAGNEDRIKLLLSGDNPNRINRDLQMLAYVSQAQARLLDALRANLKAVEANQAEAQNAKDELAEIAEEELQQKALLEQEKGRRAALLATLSKRLVAQRKEVGNVERDEQRMAGLVDKLSRLIKEQAEAAAAEQRRQQELAAARAAKAKADAEAKAQALAKARAAEAEARAERERLAKAGKSGAGKVQPAPVKPPVKLEPIDADEPKVAQQPKPEPKPEPAAKPADIALAPAAPAGAFEAMKGQLRPPVAGKLAAKFGAKRGDGPSWKGVFIRATEGADIHAIAGGRVVFAEWLRGFGNLIIVDHGGQYMSIYGNNQSLLKRAGDAVKAGDAIASAGNSGGNEESGLYFELRHQGRPFDPAGWVRF